jgi:hypothetical protein|tara:strand:- start:20 stop:268 length:249 start_codon:yes stop_codon:yes gene_type:complete
MNNKDKNGKIEFPIKFQVNASLTESNISGKILNNNLKIPIYIKYGDKEILIPEEFQDVGKNNRKSRDQLYTIHSNLQYRVVE